MRMLEALWKDERGFLLTIEALFLASILVIALVVGWTAVSTAVNLELEDVAGSIGGLDQTYSYAGTVGCCAQTNGSAFADTPSRFDVDTCVNNTQTAVEECEDDNREGAVVNVDGTSVGTPP